MARAVLRAMLEGIVSVFEGLAPLRGPLTTQPHLPSPEIKLVPATGESRDDAAEPNLGPVTRDPWHGGTAAAILLEDAFAALRPNESVRVPELRGRLIERGSEEADAIAVPALRELLRSDRRFSVDAYAAVRLSDMHRTKDNV
jgi:hypothetical protein